MQSGGPSMPYYHKGCEGEIAFWALKCKKCGETWSWTTWFSVAPLIDKNRGPAKGMTPFRMPDVKIPKVKADTKYASWGDNVPGVGFIASRLPNWPRWARILFSVGLVVLVGVGIWGILR